MRKFIEVLKVFSFFFYFKLQFQIIILFGCLMIVFAKYANGHKYVDYLQKSIVFYNKTVRIVQFGVSIKYFFTYVLVLHCKGRNETFIAPRNSSIK